MCSTGFGKAGDSSTHFYTKLELEDIYLLSNFPPLWSLLTSSDTNIPQETPIIWPYQVPTSFRFSFLPFLTEGFSQICMDNAAALKKACYSHYNKHEVSRMAYRALPTTSVSFILCTSSPHTLITPSFSQPTEGTWPSPVPEPNHRLLFSIFLSSGS